MSLNKRRHKKEPASAQLRPVLQRIIGTADKPVTAVSGRTE